MEPTNINSFDACSTSSGVSIDNSSESNNSLAYRFLSYEFITGDRINSKLLFTTDEKHIYRFNAEGKCGNTYLCKKCNSRVVVRKDKMCIQYEKYFRHNHEKEEQKHKELNVLNIIKQKCADISTLMNGKKQSVHDIFYSITPDYPDVKLNFLKHERCLQVI